MSGYGFDLEGLAEAERELEVTEEGEQAEAAEAPDWQGWDGEETEWAGWRNERRASGVSSSPTFRGGTHQGSNHDVEQWVSADGSHSPESRWWWTPQMWVWG